MWCGAVASVLCSPLLEFRPGLPLSCIAFPGDWPQHPTATITPTPTVSLVSRLLPKLCLLQTNITMSFPCFPESCSVTGLTQVPQPASTGLQSCAWPASSASPPDLPTSHPCFGVCTCHRLPQCTCLWLLFAWDLFPRFRSGVLFSRKIYTLTHSDTQTHSDTHRYSDTLTGTHRHMFTHTPTPTHIHTLHHTGLKPFFGLS